MQPGSEILGRMDQIRELPIQLFQQLKFMFYFSLQAAISQTPLEIFSFMYTHKLCTSLPEMYTSWAWELEQAGSVKKAEQVFVKGREKVAGEEAREVLTRAHERFQARVFKHTMESQEEPSGESQEQRAVLGRLQGHGKSQKVGSVRVGDAKKSERPGVLQAATNLPRGNPNSAQPFAIYQVRIDSAHKQSALARYYHTNTQLLILYFNRTRMPVLLLAREASFPRWRPLHPALRTSRSNASRTRRT